MDFVKLNLVQHFATIIMYYLKVKPGLKDSNYNFVTLILMAIVYFLVLFPYLQHLLHHLLVSLLMGFFVFAPLVLLAS